MPDSFFIMWPFTLAKKIFLIVDSTLLALLCMFIKKYSIVLLSYSKWPPVHKVYRISSQKNKAEERIKLTEYICLLSYS